MTSGGTMAPAPRRLGEGPRLFIGVLLAAPGHLLTLGIALAGGGLDRLNWWLISALVVQATMLGLCVVFGVCALAGRCRRVGLGFYIGWMVGAAVLVVILCGAYFYLLAVG